MEFKDYLKSQKGEKMTGIEIIQSVVLLGLSLLVWNMTSKLNSKKKKQKILLNLANQPKTIKYC